MLKNLSLFLLISVTASAAPVIAAGGIVNAASNSPLGGANSGIAQGAYFTIYGSGLGPTAAATASLPYSTSLGGTSVTVTPSSGAAVQAYVQFASDGQINAILPSTTPLGAATVAVTFGSATSSAAKINVVKTSFGIFTTAYGSGPAAAQYLDTSGNLLGVNSLTHAALPGQYIVLYGTGLGPISGLDNTAPGAVLPSGVTNSTVQILAGGATINPIYAGRQGNSPALDQIDFQLPSGTTIADSCYVPVAVVVNGIVSNYATISKTTSGSTCPAPLGLTPTSLKTLDSGGNVNAGLISLSHFAIPASVLGIPGITSGNVTVESGGAVFTSYNASQLYAGLLTTPGAAPPLNAVGTCVVQTTATTNVPTSTIPTAATQLNAGATLTLSGPGGTANLPFGSAGYSAQLAESIPGLGSLTGGPATFLSPGVWTVKGTGGPDIGPFTAQVTVPTQLNCTNCSSITTIDRTKPLTINWTGGGGSSDFIQIGGSSTVASIADPTKNIAVAFSCTAAANSGTFTVPVSILSQMPTSSNLASAANVGGLALVSVLGNSGTFTAPLTKGGALDLGFFGYSGLFFQIVGFN